MTCPTIRFFREIFYMLDAIPSFDRRRCHFETFLVEMVPVDKVFYEI
jgi:hypothetical protein